MRNLAVALWLALAITACGDNAQAPADATGPDGGLPTCAAVGCPAVALCTRLGECTCVQPDGSGVSCRMERSDGGNRAER